MSLVAISAVLTARLDCEGLFIACCNWNFVHCESGCK